MCARRRGGVGISQVGLAESVPAQASYQRRDEWWVAPGIIATVLGLFGLYATFAALYAKDFFYIENGAHYISPFYSPCLAANSCPEGLLTYPLFANFPWSPAILILAAPLGFRLTCYYYRKAYYRSFWIDPPGCAVAEFKKGYRGEAKFPLILQNVHRYFLFLALMVSGFLWYDAFIAFFFTNDATGNKEFHVSFINLFLVLNAALLTTYTVSCHSLRHIVGGGSDCFSCGVTGGVRYSLWKGVTRLNERHMLWAWVSLFSVALADVFIRLTALGIIPDVRLF